MSQFLLQYNLFLFNHTVPSAKQSTAKKHGARNQKMEDEPASVVDNFLHEIVNMVHGNWILKCLSSIILLSDHMEM